MDIDKYASSDIRFAPAFRIDTSFIDEINKRNEELMESITPLSEILAEQIKPVLDGNQKVVEGLSENYKKLDELYQLKEKELDDSRIEAQKAKSYNTKMLVIALISAGIAIASLAATVLIAVLGG